MYHTRFRMNTTRGGARRLLSSPQALHAAVMTSFTEPPPADDDRTPRVLWRIDRNARPDTFLHIVSPTVPDLSHLVTQAGWPRLAHSGAPGWQTRPYAPFLSRLARGDSWTFRLTANPVHSVRRHPGQRTRRAAHLTPRHQLRWLLQRQEPCGFRVLPSGDSDAPHLEQRYAVTVHSGRNLSIGRSTTPTEPPPKVTLVTTTFDGRLEVTDPDALRHTLTRGLGKAKAYGCGLMTLSPLPH